MLVAVSGKSNNLGELVVEVTADVGIPVGEFTFEELAPFIEQYQRWLRADGLPNMSMPDEAWQAFARIIGVTLSDVMRVSISIHQLSDRAHND